MDKVKITQKLPNEVVEAIDYYKAEHGEFWKHHILADAVELERYIGKVKFSSVIKGFTENGYLEDLLEALVNGYEVDLPQAIKPTELPSKAAAVEGILTEEELKENISYIERNSGLLYREVVLSLLGKTADSHRNLLSANAELSFKNQKLKKALEVAKYYLERDAHLPAEQIIDEALEETK